MIFSAASPSLLGGPLDNDVFPQALRRHCNKGYIVCAHLKRQLLPGYGWVALATAMHFFNCFSVKHGTAHVDALTLAAACFFVMSKVELFQLKVHQVVEVAFEVKKDSADYKKWHEVLLRVEAIVMEALNYDFLVPQAMESISALAPAEPACVKKVALELFVYIPMTLISQCMEGRAIAAGLLFLAADVQGCPECLGPKVVVSVEEREKVKRAVLEVLAYRQKTTGIERLDSLVQQVIRRERAPSARSLGSSTVGQ